jgi:hypothetical protein
VPANDRILVLSDGGLPSLVACAAAGQGDAKAATVAPFLWHPADPGLRLAAVARHAELCGLPITRLALAADPPQADAGSAQSIALVHATAGAVAAGFSTVIWPVHAGPGAEPDLDRVALSIDRALLVSRLIAVDAGEHGCPAVRVDTPYADFTDRQLAELAIDLDAPVHACWWWGGQGEPAASERRRWTTLLQSFGWVHA